jgi:asparagine synthase (glutamine-hydrolysing)
MPGIVGLITRMPRAQAELHLRLMLRAMSHEPFYSWGTWVDQSLGIYVGWTVQKDSFSDGMPIQNERGDVVLIFSGEEFPEPGTSRSLQERGHTFDTKGSSYLVHLYEEKAKYLQHLNGWFHGLLVDRSRGTATLFNDRYGMHRIYYHESIDALYFAAESKALLAVRPELRTTDNNSMGELVACGCVLDNRTIFAGIRVLPPGSEWTFRNCEIARKELYFSTSEWEGQDPLEFRAYEQEIRRVFSQSLDRYFGGDEAIGMSLTGGLDTRMIMACRRPAPQSLPCYSFGGMYRACRDVSVARQVAAICGQTHEVITVGSEFLSLFPHYAERSVYLTDGCIDVSHAPDLYVNERARTIAPVRMTGNYGGEVLRGIRAFRPVEPVPGLFSADLSPFLHTARTTYRYMAEGHPVSFAVFRQAPWHHHGLLALEKTQVSLRSPFLDNQLVKTVFRGPMQARANSDVCHRLIAAGDSGLARIETDRGDVCCERTLYSRAKHRFIEFAVKAEYAYDYGMPQWLAKTDRLLTPLHLERLFLGRHKFYHFRLWYRYFLRNYVREILFDKTTLSRPYLCSKMLQSIVNDHLSGRGNYTLAIHKVLTLELIHRIFIDSACNLNLDVVPAAESRIVAPALQ